MKQLPPKDSTYRRYYLKAKLHELDAAKRRAKETRKRYNKLYVRVSSPNRDQPNKSMDELLQRAVYQEERVKQLREELYRMKLILPKIDEKFTESPPPENLPHLEQKLYPPPFVKARSIFSFLFSRKTYAIIEEAIIDNEHEYFENLNEGLLWKSRWTKICGWIIFIKTAFAQMGVSTVSLLVKLWKLSG